MEDVVRSDATGRTSVWPWAAAFFVGMFGMPLLVRALDLEGLLPKVLTALPMLLLIPLVRASERRSREGGCGSPALVRYNRRALVISFAYVAVLMGAVMATREMEPTGALAWTLAIAPTLPVLALIGAMGRYLVEEQDEYLRTRTIFSALIATGILLSLATFWGFLETFGLVTHVPGWAAVPVWAIGLAIGNLVMKLRS